MPAARNSLIRLRSRFVLAVGAKEPVPGFLTGVLTFTPFHQWRHQHSFHHATPGDLDRRGNGDLWTLTVDEHLAASRRMRFAYRLARNPVVLFVIVPMDLFPIRLPVIALAAPAGVWPFYVQHQFEGVQWERQGDWDCVDAALNGSSFYKLPRVLQWFTGNIGFHHIHHLRPRVPNYNLQKCHQSDPIFRNVRPVTLWAGLKSVSYRLWDERRKRLVGFGRIRAIRRGRTAW